MSPEYLCNAVANATDIFYSTLPGKSKHEHVDAFQNSLYSFLDQNYSADYKWTTESKNKSIPVSDRVDVKGTPKPNSGAIPVIIEIDPWRADQISKKFISRNVIYGQNGKKTKNTNPIQYIAVLYKQRSSSLPEALKYIMFANIDIKNSNKNSSCTAIFFYKDQNNQTHVVYFDPNKPSGYSVSMGSIITKSTVIGMGQTATDAVDLIIPQVDSDTLQSTLKNFVVIGNNKLKARMKKCNNKTKDGYDVYVESQWENFGPKANWDRFIQIVNGWKKLNIKITKLYNYYDNSQLGNWRILKNP